MDLPQAFEKPVSNTLKNTQDKSNEIFKKSQTQKIESSSNTISKVALGSNCAHSYLFLTGAVFEPKYLLCALKLIVLF